MDKTEASDASVPGSSPGRRTKKMKKTTRKPKTSFIPKTTIEYPQKTDEHYIQTKEKRKIILDSNYPFVDNSKKFRFKKRIVRLLLRLIVFPMTKIKLGLKVYGKENLKKNKELLKNGAISVSNHINYFDYLAIMRTIKPVKPYVLSWKNNITDGSGNLVRLVGGIPIPEGNISATKEFLNAVNGILNNKGWIHVYAEGSMWEFYRPIRPFKKGAAYLATKNIKPIVPIGFSYRKPGFFRRNIFRQVALININIGEPISVDPALDEKTNIEQLTIKAHRAVEKLAGIEKNIYEPIYAKENCLKIVAEN